MNVPLKKFREGLVKRLRVLSADRLPKDTNEFIDWAHFGELGQGLLEHFNQEGSEDLREWIFDLCKESGRYELTEDGSDLRIKT